jgi:hypothetical protein
VLCTPRVERKISVYSTRTRFYNAQNYFYLTFVTIARVKILVGANKDACYRLSELRALGHTRDVAIRGERETRDSEQRQILMSPSARPSSPGVVRETLPVTDHTLSEYRMN